MATNRQLDLQELARTRPTTKGNPPSGPPSRWVTRYVMPVMILTSFAVMIAWTSREAWLPARNVSVVPVVVMRAEVQRAGTPLFQASGWVEPRPTLTYVAALADGVVEALLVVEGDEVRAGQVIGRLIDTDARIALEAIQADRQLREAEADIARAEVEAARKRRASPVHLDAPLADARSRLASRQTELAQLPARIRAAEARADYALRNLEGKRDARDAISGRQLQQAESESAATQAEAEELKARRDALAAEIAALTDTVNALTTQRELLIDETQAMAEAEARLAAAEARVRQANAAVQEAELRLERMTVRSPVAGRVLTLHSAPGTRTTSMTAAASPHSSVLVSLYDPAMLQVRADVRLEDVPLVTSGQPVRIQTAAAGRPINGVVLLATSEANLQKNTLEVKVALQDSPPSVRPEMLVQATFLAPDLPTPEGKASEQPERILVPPELVNGTGDAATVWVAAADSTSRLRTVSVGSPTASGLVEITQGLHPTDKLIDSGRDGLTDGSRIRIVNDTGTADGTG